MTSDVVLPEVNAPTARASSSALTSRVSVRTTAHETTLNNQKQQVRTTGYRFEIFFCIARRDAIARSPSRRSVGCELEIQSASTREDRRGSIFHPPNVRNGWGCDACGPTREGTSVANESGGWYFYRSVRSRRSRRFARVASGGGSWKIRVVGRGGAASWGHGCGCCDRFFCCFFVR